MSCFLFRTIHFGCSKARILTRNLGFRGNPSIFFTLRLFSNDSNQQSFTVNYLINELGFSPKTAFKVSKLVNFKTPEKPEKAINLLKKYGFTQTQISTLVRRRAELLVADTEKIFAPKLEFFGAKGVSWPQFAKRLSTFPNVLIRSLDKQIVPSYEFLRNFLHSDEKAITTVQRYPDILVAGVEKILAPNINILREHGVPDSNIAKLISRQSRAFTVNSDQFRNIVEEVAEMGFNPKRLTFVQAVAAFRGLSKSTWESKVNAFKKWGWSEEDVLTAFERHPWGMMLSEDKIFAGMDFFMNRMGLRPCVIAKRPVVLSLSLKKRIIPRFSVFQALLSKGLVKKEVSLSELFMVPENKFIKKFVMPHEKEAPELLKFYKEKSSLSKGAEIADKVC